MPNKSFSIAADVCRVVSGRERYLVVRRICGSRTRRIHSRYERTLSDLPWRGIGLTLKARARKFFCDDPGCERSVFCERLPEAAAHARKTDRLEGALLAIAFELGGRAGARLAAELGLVEGFVNKLKLVKRQGYGRGGSGC